MTRKRSSLLDCHHSVLWSEDWQPKTGEHVWCVRCQDMRKVLGGASAFVADCRTMRCRFYLVRQRKEAIRRQVLNHIRKNPEHVVRVTSRATGERLLLRAGDSTGLDPQQEALF